MPDAPAPTGRRIPSLGVNVVWTLAGYAVYMACQWAMLLVVARVGSPEKVGEFSLGLALTAPVILFTNLGLRRIQVTDATGGFRFSDYFSLRLLMNLLALAAIAGIALAGGYGRAATGVILAMGLAKAAEAASDVVYGVLQQGERMDLIAGSLLLRGLGGVVGLAIAMILTHDVRCAVLALAAAWTAVFLFYDLPRASRILQQRRIPERIIPRIHGVMIRRLFLLALPLGVVTSLGSLMSTVPSVLIEKFHGTAALGIYSILAYAYLAGHRISSAIGEAACARLARHHAAGHSRAFTRMLLLLLAVVGTGAAAAVAAAVFAGRPLLAFLYGSEYAGHARLFAALMGVAAIASLSNILDYGLTAMRRFRIQPLITGGTLLVYAALCVLWIPSRGLGGAVLALGVVSALQGICTLGVLVALLRPKSGSSAVAVAP